MLYLLSRQRPSPGHRQTCPRIRRTRQVYSINISHLPTGFSKGSIQKSAPQPCAFEVTFHASPYALLVTRYASRPLTCTQSPPSWYHSTSGFVAFIENKSGMRSCPSFKRHQPSASFSMKGNAFHGRNGHSCRYSIRSPALPSAFT